MAKAQLNITLHANQQKIHECGAKNIVVKAGKRFGKSILAIFRAIQKAGKYPNSTIWYIAPSYRQAKNIAWYILKDMLPKEYVKRSLETELYIELKTNNSRIQLIGADNEESLRGPKLKHVVLDECSYIKENVWPAIISGQLLGNKGEEPGTADFISSPNNKGINWFTDFHAEAKRKMLAGDKDWAAFYYTIYDNPTLDPKEIDKLRDNTPDSTWQLEYLAIESLLHGKRYPEFNPDNNVGYSKRIDHLPVYRGLDQGLNHPTVCLWARVDKESKVVYIYEEYCKAGYTIQENVESILKYTGRTPVEWSVIDPTTIKRSPVNKVTMLNEFARWGLHCVPGDNKDRGYDIVKMFLKKGLIKIHPTCKNLILELKNLQREDKEGDDCTDALRYLIVRIHDMFFGGNLFNVEPTTKIHTYTQDELNGMRELNFNNPYCFDNAKPQESPANWIMDEISD